MKTLANPTSARAPRGLPPVVRGLIAGALALSVVVVVASMFLLDGPATYWAKHLPHGFVEPFHTITKLGLSGWFLYPLGFAIVALAAVSLLALPRLSRGVVALLIVRFGFLFAAIAIPGLFDAFIKRLIGRARPFVVVDGSGHDNPFSYRPFSWSPAWASMPSGHATTATAAAIAIGAVWPRSRPFMWLYALIIMFSRIVVLAHRPSDLLAAVLVGVVGALLVRRWFAGHRLGFVIDHDGRVRPLSWPSARRVGKVARRVVRGA